MMKIKYTKVLLAAATVAAMSSCDRHDLISEITEVGQAVPTVYWEVGSTVCKAGENFTFQGKYTSESYRTPLRSEVWYQIIRDDVAAVSVALAGTSLSYTQTVTATDTMRSFQCYASFPHADATFNGHEFIIQGEVPTSRTLSPVAWVDAEKWDGDRFDSYYPADFKKTFLNKVYGYLTDEATAPSYYNALRNVFINYDFSDAQLTAQGLPATVDDAGNALDKSDLWFVPKANAEETQVGVYYITLDGEGNDVYNEKPLDFVAPDGIVIYPVYESPEWVFRRYDDNSGSVVSTVRTEWLPKFRALIEAIPFQDWIYDSANSVYKVDFSRAYSLRANFRAYDKDSDKLNDASAPEHEGITSLTDLKTITLN